MLWFLILSAVASPLNGWGTPIGEATGMINPYVYISAEGANPILYGAVGLSKRSDVYFGAGTNLSTTSPATSSFELFPRWFIDPSMAFALHGFWAPGQDGVILAPEVHINRNWSDHLSFTSNVSWRPLLGTTKSSVGLIAVTAAPELHLTEAISVFVEADPAFPLSKEPVSLLIVPGASLVLGRHDQHSFAFGLQVPVLPEVADPSVGMFYAFMFLLNNE